MRAYYLPEKQVYGFGGVHLCRISPLMYAYLTAAYLSVCVLISAQAQAQTDSLVHPATAPPASTTALPDSAKVAPTGRPAAGTPPAGTACPARAGLAAEVPNRKRMYLLAGSSVLTLGSTYVYLQNKWWSEGYSRFGFDGGRDWRYASNLDKLGHVLGGVFTADAYYAGFRWAGMPQRKAEWYAFGAAAFVQLSIEFKDGFSPRYGFSWADVTAGTLGGFWPMLQNRSPFFRDSQLKFSYWQRTNKYFDHRGIKTLPFSIDDYINQTYWFSFSPRYVGGPKFRQAWPAWLQVSVGAGLEAETWSIGRTGEGGRWEFYLAPDLDLVALFKPRKPFMRRVLHVLNYVKVPAPTLQLGPKPRFWWLYF